MSVIEVAIHPDEAFMVFVSTKGPDARGGFDLYASFNEGDDRWSAPVDIGGLNTEANEHFPTLSANGEYLFFVSDRVAERFASTEDLTVKQARLKETSPQNGRPDIYWVSSKILDASRP